MGALHGSVTVCHQSFRPFTVKGDLKVAINAPPLIRSGGFAGGTAMSRAPSRASKRRTLGYQPPRRHGGTRNSA